MTEKLYADRYAPDLEPWFSKHMSAMTGEDLHNKSDIACELAYRDQAIADLLQAVKVLGEAFCSVNEFSNQEERKVGRQSLISARATAAKYTANGKGQ